jgi:hypothetical protein
MNQFQKLITARLLTTCFDVLWDPQRKHNKHSDCVISQVGSGCLQAVLDNVLPANICFVACDLNFYCGKFIETSLTNQAGCESVLINMIIEIYIVAEMLKSRYL